MTMLYQWKSNEDNVESIKMSYLKSYSYLNAYCNSIAAAKGKEVCVHVCVCVTCDCVHV